MYLVAALAFVKKHVSGRHKSAVVLKTFALQLCSQFRTCLGAGFYLLQYKTSDFFKLNCLSFFKKNLKCLTLNKPAIALEFVNH